LLARVIWCEILRKEEYQAVLILMGLYLLFAFGGRLIGLNQSEAVSLLINLGLWLSATLSALLTLIISVRSMTAEIESHTVYPLLAKPVQRSEVVLGKFVGVVLAGWICFGGFIGFTLVIWLAAIPLPGQDLLMLCQALLLHLVALGLLGALGILFSLLMPTSVAILISGFLYFLGSAVVDIIRGLTGESVGGGLVSAVLGYLPQFAKLSLMQRFTDGAGHLEWGVWVLLVAYGVLYTLVGLVFSMRVFVKRRL
jgi:ABC-type transport system involved in multi-copper enzyme maturation permease subunit